MLYTERFDNDLSNYHGVHWDKRDQIWVVRIATLENGKYVTKYSAYLSDEEEAARVYDICAMALWGIEYVTTNYDKDIYKNENIVEKANKYKIKKMVSKTGFRGVTKRSKNSFKSKYNSKNLGCFKNPVDAAIAYDKELIRQNKNLDKMNFPLDNYEEAVK